MAAIQALDDDCSTLVYAQEGLFHFAIGTGERVGSSDAGAAAGGAREGGSDVGAVDGNGGGSGGRGGAGNDGAVTESLPVHMGNISDFRVNLFSRWASLTGFERIA